MFRCFREWKCCSLFNIQYLIRVGYIPRLKEHFGHGYTRNTKSAQADFAELSARSQQLPERIQQLQGILATRKASPKPSGREESAASPAAQSQVQPLPPVSARDRYTGTFISGYTGYIPQLKNHFGKSIRKTVDGKTALLLVGRQSRKKL